MLITRVVIQPTFYLIVRMFTCYNVLYVNRFPCGYQGNGGCGKASYPVVIFQRNTENHCISNELITNGRRKTMAIAGKITLNKIYII